MNILMMTNTYKPIVGGLEKSVETFSKEFRKKGHRVIIVAPEFEGSVEEEDVIRIPAIQHFNGSDFSVQLPVPGVLNDKLGDFRADIVHSHHPYLVGDAALRLAYKYNAPLVFTHHTLYEQNTHYVGEGEALKRFVVELSVGYANLADQIFAPSESVAKILKERNVQTPIVVVPTGIDVNSFAQGDGLSVRNDFNIPGDAYVVGYAGRLALEKNLEFLSQVVAIFLKRQPNAHFLVVGEGPSEEIIKTVFKKEGADSRLHFAGRLEGKKLVAAYHAMDVFAFASQSETQGLVLVEAMAAGVPVVAQDAPGVREVVEDKINGRIISSEGLGDFTLALDWMASQNKSTLQKIHEACLKTAKNFTVGKSVNLALETYACLGSENFKRRNDDDENPWLQTARVIKAQWELTKNLAKATSTMIAEAPPDKKSEP